MYISKGDNGTMMKKFKKEILVIISMLFVLFCIPNYTYAESSENEYSILLRDENNTEDFQQLIKKHNLQVTYSVPEIGFYKVKAKSNEIPNLEKNKKELYVGTPLHSEISNGMQRVYSTPSTSNSLWDYQWDVKQVTENGKSFNLSKGSHNVVVGIIDSGIDLQHPDLQPNILPGSKNLVPAGGYKGKENTETGDINDINDKRGHGTHVAGLVAANGRIKGVAPNVGIRSYRVFGKSSGQSIWITKAIVEAAKDGTDVISMSLSGFKSTGPIIHKDPETGKTVKVDNELVDILAYERAIKYARNKGAILVSSSGNDGLDVNDTKKVEEYLLSLPDSKNVTFLGKSIQAPASLPGVVTVSSTGPDKKLSTFSNFGYNFIDITAPGGDFKLLKEYGPEAWNQQGLFMKENILSTSNNQGYFYTAGTSSAAPKVSAALALIIDKYGKRTPEQTVNHLMTYGIDFSNSNEKIYFGNGHLNVYKALSK